MPNLTQIFQSEIWQFTPVIVLGNLRKDGGNVAGGCLIMPMLFTLTLITLKLDKAGCSKCG